MASRPPAQRILGPVAVGAAAPPQGEDARRGGRWRVVVLGAAAVLAIAGALLLADVWRLRTEISAGRTELNAVRHGAARNLPDMRRKAAGAVAHLRRADSLARRSLWLRAASSLPVADTQVRAVRSITAAAARAGAIGDDAVVAAEAAAGRPRHTGADRQRLLDELDAALRSADTRLAGVRVHRPRGALLPPLAGAVKGLERQLRAANVALREAHGTVTTLESMLAGPRTYLVLAANNSEMRGAGGMPLQVGTITFGGGEITAAQFRSATDLLLQSPVPVPAPIEALYGWLSPGREWRNTASSPNFPETAPVYKAMAAAAGVGNVDGVIQIDVAAFGDIVRAVGPIDVAGGRYDADVLERLVLHDLYALYRPSTQDQRHEALGQLAVATFDALQTRAWDTSAMVGAVAHAVAGRHIMLWSSVPAEQATWHRLRADGALAPDGLLLAVQNHTGNKLDYFVRSSGTLVVDQKRPRPRLTLRMRVRNAVPEGEVDYVAGNNQGLAFGTYRGLVTIYLPAGASDVRATGGDVVAVGADPPTRVVGLRVDVEPGAVRNLSVEFSLPAGSRHVTLLPAGRTAPTNIRFGTTTVSDAQRRALRW